MKKVLLLIAITFTSITHSTFSTEYYSFSPYSNIGLNFNFSRSSSGMILDSYCPSCIDLQKGFGLGSNFGIGALNEAHNSLLNMRVQYGAYLDYNNHYSEFTNDKFLGNLISGNNIISGNVNYNLKVYLKTLEFVPFVYLYPIKSLNLAFKLGLNLGINIGSKYDFSESTKDDNVFLKNGKKENIYSGSEFPGISNVNFSIPIGIKYDFQFKDIVVSPEIQYSIGLTKLHKESDWGLNTLKAGLSLVYKIEKQKPTPPPVVVPPAPKLPEPAKVVVVKEQPQKSKDITSTSDWYINGHKLHSNDTICIDTYETDYYDELPVIPYIFFSHNSAELQTEWNLEDAEINVMENPEYIQLKFLNILPDYAKQGKISGIKILYTSEEEEDIGQKRIDFLKKLFKDNDAKIDNIKFTTERIDISKLKYPELIVENMAAIIDFKYDSNTNLKFLNSSTKEYPAFDNAVKIMPKSDYYLSAINGSITMGDEIIEKIETAETDFSLSLSNLYKFSSKQNHKLYLNYTLTNSADFSKSFIDSLNVIVNINPMPEGTNIRYRKLDDTVVYSEHILALFDFDKSSIKSINYKVKVDLFEALESNKKVEIYGSSDDFGTQEYNSGLISKRVNNVLKAIKVNPKKVTIIKSDTYPFDNDSPIGRMYNRSVMVRIYDDNGHNNDEIK